MLIVHRLAVGGHRYYLHSVTLGEEPGRWLGRTGPVTGRELRDALPSERGRLPGLDLTFAAPKSVSVIHGLAEAPAVDAVAAAHDRAVDAAMAYLTDHACVVRTRGRAVVADGFVAAAFRHRVSRADDPHLHTHVLVANQATTDDGRRYALHIPLLYGERRAAGAIYHLVLRHELSSGLGVEWGAPVRACADVEGVPPAVRAAFSRRGAQIRQEQDGPRRWAERVTRPPRIGPIDIEQLRRSWHDRADALGWSCPSFEPVGRRRQLPPVPEVVPTCDRWTRGDVLVALADRWPDGAPADHVASALARTLAQPGVVRIGPGSTPAHAAERFTTDRALARQAEVAARFRAAETVDPLLPGPRLTLVAPDAAAAEDLTARTGKIAVAASSRLPTSTLVFVHPERLDSEVAAAALAVARGPVLVARSDRREVVADGPVATVAVRGGSITVADSAAAAAGAALVDFVAARQQGVAAVLVVPAAEVADLNREARGALRAAGVIDGPEVGGFARGDVVRFTHARPAAGIDRHDVATVGGIGGDMIHVGDQRLRPGPSVVHAHAVPRLPSVIARFDEVFVLGAPLRVTAPSHRYVTVGLGRGPAAPAWTRRASEHELIAALGRCGSDAALEHVLRLRRAAEDITASLGLSAQLARSVDRALVLSR